MEISDVKKNTKIKIDGILYNVEESDFTKPGKGQSVYRLKLRNLKDGGITNRTYRSGDKVDDVRTTSEEKQYLYKDNDQFVFMDSVTFEQISVPEALIGDKKNYFKEGMTVTMLIAEDQPIDITLPITVDLKVVQTEISTKTATITPQLKQSVVETGYTVGTPTFIKEGDLIKIDTRTGQYVERVNK
ncbi:MAG TPA: elongation factor P [Dehalococcoidales bacterium]|nr:elongation factor P [Dehalococcoidales bacterium]